MAREAARALEAATVDAECARCAEAAAEGRNLSQNACKIPMIRPPSAARSGCGRRFLNC
jgi:hypothetical protein